MKPIEQAAYADLPSCFLTATDTDAGKTHVACEIITAWRQAGFIAAAFKPIASGAIWQNGQLVSEDAMRLAAVSGQDLKEINPYTFEKPASPHIADESGVFDLNHCVRLYQQLLKKYDRVLVEGVGGWCVPLSESLMLNDLVLALDIPVVMVSRIGLGCINHSVLTVKQIKHDGRHFQGWIANCIDSNFEDQASNIDSIAKRINHKS